MMRRYRILLYQGLLTIFLLIAWEAAGHSSSKLAFLIGTPRKVVAELWQMITAQQFHVHLLVTGAEAVIGLLIGTAIGTIMGLTLWYSDTAARIVRPFVLALGTLPVFALAPLMIVWFGIGFEMKVAMATLATVFVAFSQSYRAAHKVSGEFVDFLTGMGATRFQILRIAIIPGSIDWVLASMRMNIGFSLLGAFLGEFIAASEGLGFLILRAASLYNIPRAFAATAGLIALAMSLDWIGARVESRRHLIVQLVSVHGNLWSRR